jgi:hypothetical protein
MSGGDVLSIRLKPTRGTVPRSCGRIGGSDRNCALNAGVGITATWRAHRPFSQEPEFGVTSVNYNLKELLARSERSGK